MQIKRRSRALIITKKKRRARAFIIPKKRWRQSDYVLKKRASRKVRRCLKCKKIFVGYWGHRLCDPCRAENQKIYTGDYEIYIN